MNQKDGVYLCVVAVLGHEPKLGTEVTLSDSQTEQVKDHMVQMLITGQMSYKDGPPDHETASKYVGGLLNNWLRKDKRLNGNVDYVAKKPGSRTGAGDEQLTALKSLLALTKDSAQRADIQAEITRRTNELEAAKRKPINIMALPEHLRHLAPKA